MKDNITKLLGLEDIILKTVEENGEELHLWIELPRTKHRCPVCGYETDKIHDYREQTVKDVSSFGKRVYLHVRRGAMSAGSAGNGSMKGIPFCHDIIV